MADDNATPATKDDIVSAIDQSTKLLLEHMGGIKYELGQKIENLEKRMDSMEQTMSEKFEDAHRHRQALQEDLEATMSMLDRNHQNHEKRIKRLEEEAHFATAA